jgi:hypothetical protein
MDATAKQSAPAVTKPYRILSSPILIYPSNITLLFLLLSFVVAGKTVVEDVVSRSGRL